MKSYPKYKPTGIDWIGDIPSHWEVKKLKYITYMKARVGWHGLKADEFSLDENLPYCVTGTDLIKGKVNWSSCYRISEERYEEDPYIKLKENDLLVTKDGTIGKVAIVEGLNGKAILNSGVFVMRPLENKYDTRFMFWLIESTVFSEFVGLTSRGSTIIHLYQDNFLNWSITLPNLEEQTAIANYLDEKTTQIDTLIVNKQKLIELLKEERTAIINHAVTKGINPNAKLKPSGVDWLGDVPENWGLKKLKYVAKLKSGDTITSDSIRPEGHFKVFGGNGLRGFTATYTHHGDYVLIGRQGALCGNINYAAGKFFASEHAIVVTIIDGSNFVWLGELLRIMVTVQKLI